LFIQNLGKEFGTRKEIRRVIKRTQEKISKAKLAPEKDFRSPLGGHPDGGKLSRVGERKTNLD